MLYEYMQPNIHQIGDVIFKPGMNKVPEKSIKAMTDSTKKYLANLIETGVIKAHTTKAAITVKTVKNTADLDLLKMWADDKTLKGPVKGAVRKQIAEIESIADKATKDENEVV